MAVSGGGPPVSPGYPMAPKLRFDAINEAWGLLQQQMGTWILAVLVLLVVSFVVSFVINIVGAALHLGFLVFPILGIVSVGISYIFMGGLFKMAIKQIRGEAIAPGDVLSATDVAGPLIVAGILVGLATEIGFCLCIIPGFIVGGLLMFTLPLVVDRGMGATDAMQMSWNTLKSDLVTSALFWFVINLVMAVGAIACGVGLLITVPLGLLSVAVTYRDFFMGPGTATAYPTPPPPTDIATPPPPTNVTPPPPPADDAPPPKAGA